MLALMSMSVDVNDRVISTADMSTTIQPARVLDAIGAAVTSMVPAVVESVDVAHMPKRAMRSVA